MNGTFTLQARWPAAMSLAALVALVACGGGGNVAASGDVQAPVASIAAPANFTSGLAGSITVTANASDNIGVTLIEIQLDGQAVGSNGSGASHSVAVDTNAYASGQHIVRTRASDAAGNQSPWVTATVSFGGSRMQAAGFTRQASWITGLLNATAFAQAPDGRLLVAQQGGALRVVTSAGALLGTAMLTVPNIDFSGERGLVGVTLHPEFARNGWVYVYHTTTANGTHNRVTRYTASGDSASGAFVIADLPALSAATNHNGGAMHFGSDGKLYVAVGDNANSAQAPDVASVFGKMLRFNDDGSIPGDNPVCTTAGVQSCAIWARGLRNPFTFAVQPGTGRMHINDVGQNTWEEINLGTPLADYGWPSTEGPTSAAGVTAPLFAYRHSATNPPSGDGAFIGGCAITGGTFYPGSGAFPPAYRGSYYFADFCSALIGRLDLVNGNAAYAFGQVPSSPVDMLAGLDGALYVLTQSTIVRFSAP